MSKPSNRDSAETVYRVKILLWANAAGLMGLFLGYGVAQKTSINPLVAVPLGYLLVAGGTYVVASVVAGRAAAAAGAIYHPSGSSTPAVREYSYAESLVVRERFEDAAAAYELYCIEYPDDPEPYLRLGRLHRDKLARFEEAIHWFRRARSDATVTSGQELMIVQDIIDIYVNKLRTPRRAIPELALLVQRFPGTRPAEAARKQLTEMRTLLEQEREGGEPFTDQFFRRLRDSSVEQAARLTLNDVEDRESE